MQINSVKKLLSQVYTYYTYTNNLPSRIGAKKCSFSSTYAWNIISEISGNLKISCFFVFFCKRLWQKQTYMIFLSKNKTKCLLEQPFSSGKYKQAKRVKSGDSKTAKYTAAGVGVSYTYIQL